MNGCSVLDIGIGKGGDLWKYSKQKISYIIGVDNEKFLLSDAEDCALTRWKQIIASSTSTLPTCVFVHMDGRSNIYENLKSKNIDMDFDVVNCFFAIHYFFRDEPTLSSFLQNVNEMLTFNGFFVGTLVDGKTVHENLIECDNNFTDLSDSSDNQPKKHCTYSIKGVYNVKQQLSQLSPYGNQIDVFLNDSIIHDYDHLQPFTKKEYLVNFDKFVEIAKHFGLELVDSCLFNEYYQNYNGASLNSNEQRFSFINRTFVFKKVSNSKYHQNNIVAKLGK